MSTVSLWIFFRVTTLYTYGSRRQSIQVCPCTNHPTPRDNMAIVAPTEGNCCCRPSLQARDVAKNKYRSLVVSTISIDLPRAVKHRTVHGWVCYRPNLAQMMAWQRGTPYHPHLPSVYITDARAACSRYHAAGVCHSTILVPNTALSVVYTCSPCCTDSITTVLQACIVSKLNLQRHVVRGMTIAVRTKEKAAHNPV